MANRAGTTNRKHKVSSSFSSGLGPWQNQQIQALLSQFVKRKCLVIPVILSSAKITPDLPWTLGEELLVLAERARLPPNRLQRTSPLKTL